MQPKERIIEMFLQMIAGFKPLVEAKLATLGGKGFEAEIWLRHNVPEKQGFLIEWDNDLGNDLIRRFQYRFCPNLEQFPSRLRQVHGKDAYVDAFHLDFCGTAETRITEIQNTLQLISAKNSARCLAITVHDARENKSIKQHGKIKLALEEMLNADEAEVFFQKLIAQQKSLPKAKTDHLPTFFKQHFDPIKGAKREFGLFVLLLQAMIQQGGNILFPDRIERYVYVSRFMNARRPARMRTYLFHFACDGREFTQANIRSLLEQWVNSNLWWVKEDEVISVFTHPIPEVRQTMTTLKFDKLQTIATAVGGEALEEFEALLAAAQNSTGDGTTLQEIADILMRRGKIMVVEAPASPQAPTTPHEPTRAPRRGGRNSKPKQSWDALSKREQIEWKIKALETKKENGGKFPKNVWDKMLKDDFGAYNKHLAASLRSNLARTSGSTFRPQFEARIREVFGKDAKPLLDRLAKL